MIIKKLIAGSMFSMLLVSEMAAADWGDVYYCQMTKNLTIMHTAEMKNYPLERFQFKLDQTKNAMVFGSKGLFRSDVLELDDVWSAVSQEAWKAINEYSMTTFGKGALLYTRIGLASATVVSADCEKF